MGGIKRHLSYANVAATLALVLAMSGGAIAATGGFTSSGRLQACVGKSGGLTLLKAGKKCRHGQISIAWNQTGPQGAKGSQGTPGASAPAGANGATVANATTAGTATTALTANNALELGGVPASEFTRSDCESQTGQIKGFALIPAHPGFEFINLADSYNCSGEPVEAEQITKGNYIVRFRDNPATIAIGTSNGETSSNSNVIGVHMIVPGEWRVESWNAEDEEEHAEQFALLIP
ncbi:MAG TPA: hypothetical protein VGF47_00590 [Solirubrobacteraceae bacterium]|jgi:hypothetical protein